MPQIQNLASQLNGFLPPSPTPSPDLWISSSPAEASPPPSYGDSIADLPPDYTTTDALATAHILDYTLFPSLNPSVASSVPACLRWSGATSPNSSIILDEKLVFPDIDFSNCDPENIRTHAKKKGKGGAAKKTTPANDGGNEEEKKDGLVGEENAGNGGNDGGNDGGAGGGAGGDGGEGGGDDFGDWDDGKKKKGKKGKKAQEEAEKKRKEHEEAERKKKEDEDAAAAAEAEAATAPTSDPWAEAGAGDDYGEFTTSTKKKKGKKGKVCNPYFSCLGVKIYAVDVRLN